MNKEIRPLVTNEPVEFENKFVEEVQDFRKITDNLRGIYGMIPQTNKDTVEVLTRNCLDLETLRFVPVMPKNHRRHSYGFSWSFN